MKSKLISLANKMFILDTIEDVEKSFNKNAEEVGNTKELNNVILIYEEAKEPEVSLPTKMDYEERDWLYENINSAIEKIRRERNTRQAIIYNLHDSGLEHNCLNLLHLYYRKDKLHMNVYVRSMNYDANFKQDLYTFNIILNKACNELMLDKGQITVFIMSLHEFKK